MNQQTNAYLIPFPNRNPELDKEALLALVDAKEKDFIDFKKEFNKARRRAYNIINSSFHQKCVKYYNPDLNALLDKLTYVSNHPMGFLTKDIGIRVFATHNGIVDYAIFKQDQSSIFQHSVPKPEFNHIEGWERLVLLGEYLAANGMPTEEILNIPKKIEKGTQEYEKYVNSILIHILRHLIGLYVKYQIKILGFNP